MNIIGSYSNLYDFFASWFPDADFDELSDRDIVISFKSVSHKDKINVVIKEISLLIIGGEPSIENITRFTNIHFNDELELMNWLIEIKKYLKE